MQIKIRITGGFLRNRNILLNTKFNVRPTLNRCRQYLFDVLINTIFNNNEVKVLDVCAGSGAFGIEAISRGATKAFFLEIQKELYLSIKNHLNKFNIHNQAIIYNKNALTPPKGEPVNVVFIDLPYDSSFLWHKIIRNLIKNQWISFETIIILETHKEYKFPLCKLENLSLKLLREKIIANSKFIFLEKI
ncbi:hypothetical protein AB836_01505 [Rickettsiales bacterium (ex Bugula neritina AB1)]|nr:hypothetical protein AB836_01505 [Rickettsiales bacterium (ex Bugula neritina AB1)]